MSSGRNEYACREELAVLHTEAIYDTCKRLKRLPRATIVAEIGDCCRQCGQGISDPFFIRHIKHS